MENYVIICPSDLYFKRNGDKMDRYSVKLDTFEGPLDLLLHLIQEAEVDIYDIPVAEITEQYMNYIRSMQELELDIASEYLVMAATLLMIKSKMLLPKHEETLLDDEPLFEDDDPREELVSKLVEYRKYKEIANELKAMAEKRNQIFSRPPVDLEQYVDEKNPLDGSGVTLFDMLRAYQKMMQRNKFRVPKLATVKSEDISVEDRMVDVLNIVEKKNGACRFDELFSTWDKRYVVVTFLAILELMKTKAIQCVQASHFSEIFIYSRERWEEQFVGR